MSGLIADPGAAQLEPLRRAYAEAGAERRRVTAIGATVLLVAIAAAWVGAEVDLGSSGLGCLISAATSGGSGISTPARLFGPTRPIGSGAFGAGAFNSGRRC